MPKPAAAPVAAAGAPGSWRARLRLVAVVLLGLLALLFGLVGTRLYFAPPVDPLLSSLLGLAAFAAAMAYVLSAYWVVKQLRWGHLLALGVALAGAVFGLSGAMTWVEWAVVALNLLAFAALLGALPRKRPPSA